MARITHEVTPSASRLTNSLRDLGYDLPTAVAELVDNSISAGAERIDIDFEYRGHDSFILVSDDGHGMTAAEVTEAIRLGTRRTYCDSDLGRFGLGLKTASLSQARRLTVVSRRAPQRRWISKRTLDLDYIERVDRWEVFEPTDYEAAADGLSRLQEGPGTVVGLEKLDRLFEGVDPDSGWGERRLIKSAEAVAAHLGVIFHRFIEGTASSRRITILVNGSKIGPWNPFAPTEERTQKLAPRYFSLRDVNDRPHSVTLHPYVLPPRAQFSSRAEFERLSGPKHWNRQQGLYIYRGDRLVQVGGWSGLRAFDEHTKLARAALQFPRSLDHQFKINVAKMRVSIPAQLKEMLTRPINELCAVADATYRHSGHKPSTNSDSGRKTQLSQDLSTIATALKVAALEAGRVEELLEIREKLNELHPPLADALKPT